MKTGQASPGQPNTGQSNTGRANTGRASSGQPSSRAPRDSATARPRVVIIGGGFAGLTAARDLADAPVDLTLIDRRNHHLFQPLLYQVASAALSPAQIATPIREVLGRQQNARVLLAEATDVDVENRRVVLDRGELVYDYLIVAAGAESHYFGNDAWSRHAPGLKNIEDARAMREQFLLAFEEAEREDDPERRAALLTFVIVGGGPTGVELAGAFSEIALRTIPRDFRRVDTRAARIILAEAGERLLPSFPPANSERAKRDLESLGVDVRLRTKVTSIQPGRITLKPGDGPDAGAGADVTLAVGGMFWGAGVRPVPLAARLGAPTDKGRVRVNTDLTIPDHPEVFVIGDIAKVIDPASGDEVPGMAPGAMQMGKYAAATIAREAGSGGPPDPASRRPFRYTDKGLLATIGRNKAVATVGGRHFGGFPAFALWAAVHIYYLINFRSRLMVMLEWIWAYLLFRRGARLITATSGKPTPAADRTPSGASDRPEQSTKSTPETATHPS